MSAPESVATLFVSDEESADLVLAQARVSARTIKSPDKETQNEDAAAIIPVGDDALVLAVADGVGGSPAGRDAAQLAMGTLKDALGKKDVDTAKLRSTILDAIEAANRAILELGRRAATTLVVAEIVGGKLRGYHIGDSELLAVGQRGRMKLRIIPHSPTGFAVEAGLLDENEAVQHEQRHVIFNVLGADDMRVDIAPVTRLAVRDTVLLASDGLLDNLYVDEIVEIIRKGPLPAAADRLLAAARRRMTTEGNSKPSKPDDLTIVLYRGAGGAATSRS